MSNPYDDVEFNISIVDRYFHYSIIPYFFDQKNLSGKENSNPGRHGVFETKECLSVNPTTGTAIKLESQEG